MMEHAGLVHSIARRIQPLSINFACSRDDLISEGFIGLALAYEDYDPSKGKFVFYACLRIQWKMLDYIRKWRGKNGQKTTLPLDDNIVLNDIHPLQVLYNHEKFNHYIDILHEKTQIIMRMYYIEGLKLYEIANRLSCSKQWVSRCRLQGLKAVRKYFQLVGETYEELEDDSVWRLGTDSSSSTGYCRCA